MTELKRLQAELAEVKAKIRALAPNGNYCPRCYATNVYWMTIPEIRKKPFLFNDTGGKHLCWLTRDNFKPVPE